MSGFGRTVVSVPMFAGLGQSPADRQNISSLLSQVAWSGTNNITYSFPTSPSLYGDPNSYGAPPDTSPYNGFGVLSPAQQYDAARAFSLISTYTGLAFSNVVESNSTHAYIRLANSSTPPTAHAYFPSTAVTGGDAFFGTTGRNPAMGNFDSASAVLHEIGHSLGLKHGQDNEAYGLMNANRRDIEFSLMNYPSYIGAPENFNTASASPKTYMMYDIAALQYMYGANFSAAGQRFTYTWSPATGEMFINGFPQGMPVTNTIFETVWTAGAVSTYDLRNFVQAQFNDMRPGGWMLFSPGQLAHLNAYSPSKPHGEIFAQGNVYNSLLYYGNSGLSRVAAGLGNSPSAGSDNGGETPFIDEAGGDMRSLIANLLSGPGSDTVIGNAADNTIMGGAGDDEIIGGDGNDALDGEAGNDTLTGGAGNDTLTGGAGNDTIHGGEGDDIISGGPGDDTINLVAGRDTLRDILADMDDDTILGAQFGDALDIGGVLVGRAGLGVSRTSNGADLSIGGVSIQIAGDFANGDFIVVPRGSGAGAHTTVVFEPFLPALAEGRSVSEGDINGIDEPFLTGDGTVQFELRFLSAASAYSNTLGYYEVAADGTIHDVTIAFANTHGAVSGSVLNLGTPDDGDRLGFFLIQDGYNLFGDLPGDLSFVTPGTGTAANLDGGSTVLLRSATRGDFAATIFHSFSTLNPGSAGQVLSGVMQGGLAMLIGFEDLPSATGDRDFQDVLVGVWTTKDGVFLG